MIKTYLKVELSSEGESPKQLIERMRKIGAVPVVGDYDFEIVLGDEVRLFDKLDEVHRALGGSNVRYTVTTRTDVGYDSMARNSRLLMPYVDQKPIELKKAIYKAKLDRWRDMGLEVTSLEALLEKDLDQFKIASKDFLKTHLDRLSVVKDKHPPENRIDGEILALLDEEGKTLDQVVAATGYFEDQVTLSLGRLISAGSVRRVLEGSDELFCLVPPPALQVRKAVEVVPAKSDNEALVRALGSISKEGISSKEVFALAKLPRDQLARAISNLEDDGKVREERRGKKTYYYRI